MDLVIRGARVADGTGGPSYTADVAVHEGRVVDIGRIPGGGRRTLDAHGLVLAPGFIDMHAHSDLALLR
ncbi:D-aminoacylase, partial [Streptomyces sp. SID12501]|nr:D-aminoacylase [Streptomyces sp. SID12501]